MPLFDLPETIRVVDEDVRAGFDGVFEAMDDLRPVGPFVDAEIGADGVSVLAWEWSVRHVGSLQGTPATGRELTLRGVTIVDGRGSEVLFSRYIDWLALYAELGAVTIARPPVDDRSLIHGNVPHPVPPAS
jgi:hypothetical protein